MPSQLRTPVSISWRPFAATVLVAAIAVVMGFRQEYLLLSVSQTYGISALVSLISLATIGAVGRLKFWSSGFFYALLLASFHLGIPVVRYLSGGGELFASAYTRSWFTDTLAMRNALWLCIACMLTFTLGYLLASKTKDQSTPDDSAQPQTAAALGMAGLALVGGGALMYMGHAAIAAPSLYRGAGKAVYEATIAGSGCGPLVVRTGMRASVRSGRRSGPSSAPDPYVPV